MDTCINWSKLSKSELNSYINSQTQNVDRKVIIKNITKKKICDPDRDIRSISRKDIDDDFSLGIYDNYHVIIINKNGYINATKMCSDMPKFAKSKKKFCDWANCSDIIAMKEIIADYDMIEVDELTIILDNGFPDNLKGVYVHPLLVPIIIAWIAPGFNIEMAMMSNNYFIRKAIEDKNEILRHKTLTENDKLKEF
jgi:hypothetical protein